MKTPKTPTRAATSGRLALGSNTLLLSLGICLAGFTATAESAPGDLDPEFGTDGIVFFDQGEIERWHKVLPLPNGGILVAGWTGSSSSIATSKHIARLDSKGDQVPSFGNQGQVTLNLGILPSPATDRSAIDDMIALPGGKILAVVSENYTLSSVARTKVSVIRLQANGSLDPAFGGNGIVVIDTLRSNIQYVTRVALDPQGRIFIVGGASRNSVAAIRLTPEGHLDSTFSGDGMAKHHLAGEAWPESMAVQPDGKIVVVGSVSNSVSDPNKNLMACRILPDGNLDPDFANSGKLTLDIHGRDDIANAVCIRPNGKIIVAGSSRAQNGVNENYDQSLFVGLDENGQLDNSFGAEGIVVIDASSGLLDQGVAAATLMQDGRIVATSTVLYSGGGTRFAAIRLMPSGIPDSTFSAGGSVQIPGTEAPSGSDWARDIALDPSGGILVIGGADNPQGRGGVLVRLKGDPDSDGDGVVDASETNTGIYVSPFDTGTDPNNRDSDGDGLSDGEEIFQFFTNPLNPDTDGDGFLDGYEVQTGKSPTDPLDKPALVAEVRTAIEFSFPSALGKTYRIEDSPDMTAWSPVEGGISGNGGTITRFYSTRNKEKRFFRVEEQVEP